MTKYFIFLLLLLTNNYIYAQYYNETEEFLKANNVWVYGKNRGFDFTTNPPQAITTSIQSEESCASVSNSDGELLFYTGSHGTIWNRDHVPMQNGTGLTPFDPVLNNASSAQGNVIVPVIGTPSKYYVFRNMQAEGYWSYHAPPYLSYSVVDMTLDGGLGGVEASSKNLPLYNYGLQEAMIAIPGDDCDVWLLTISSRYSGHIPDDINLPDPLVNYFLAWHITEQGINPIPVVSKVRDGLNLNFPRLMWGSHMAVSPDRTLVAWALMTEGGFYLGKFDPSTGIVDEGIVIPGQTNYGICFSPDNSKVYCGVSTIYQYDITSYDSATIKASEYPLVTPNGVGISLKLYNGTIYTSSSYYGISLSKIKFPNNKGAAAGFESGDLISGLSGNLPTDVVFPANKYEINVHNDAICHSEEDKETKILSVSEGFSYYEWNDGSSGNSKQVSEAGTYWVKYYNKKCATVYSDTFHIELINLIFSLGSDTTVLFCDHPDSHLQFEPEVIAEGVTYLWQDGSMDKSYLAFDPGLYWVELTKGKCSSSDTIKIGTVHLNLSDTTLCNGVAINLSAYAPDVPDYITVQWNNGSNSSQMHITDTGVYWLQITQEPCTLTDSMVVAMEICECFASVPNAFSPNGDGINDYFSPVIEFGCPVSTFELRIYNRFGERVFYGFSSEAGWDGTFKGQPVDMGVYFYELTFTGGTKQKKYYFKGDISLLR